MGSPQPSGSNKRKYHYITAVISIIVSLQLSAWISMDQHGSAWVSMDQHGSAWIRMDKHGSAWISMDQHGSAWISIISLQLSAWKTPHAPYRHYTKRYGVPLWQLVRQRNDSLPRTIIQKSSLISSRLEEDSAMPRNVTMLTHNLPALYSSMWCVSFLHWLWRRNDSSASAKNTIIF